MFEHIHDPKARVRALCEFGGQVEVDPTIPPKRYFKSGHEMLRMATVYLEEKKVEQAFILYTKFITLFVEKLPKHPEYKTATPKEKQSNTQKLKLIFPKAEKLKGKLTEIYEAEEIQRQALQRKKDEEFARQAEEREKQKEESRKADLKRQADEEDKKIRDAFGADMIREQEEQYRRLQEQERQKLKHKDSEGTQPGTQSVHDYTATGQTVDKPKPETRLDDYMAGNTTDRQVDYPTVPPPAYGSVISDQVIPPAPVRPDVPARHLKPSAPLPLIENSGEVGPQAIMPSVDRSTKPSHHFTSAGGSVNAYGLKKVWIPSELMVKFLNIAQPNTLQKLETGGFLFGKFSHEEFRVTHLIVIKQKGEPDSFKDLSDEDELWELQEKYDIVQLGWIHTHPTQTAFLSSVDQHVQASFQCMLPESIAIVCSPKFEETGVFYLTPDYGLDFVRKCTGKGFHPHPTSPAIFETCTHAVIDPIGKVTVIDLRT